MSSLSVAELHRRVAAILEGTERGLLAWSGPGPTVAAILSWLERDDLTPAQMKDLLEQLRVSGHLAEFLNLVANRQMREFLRRKEVPWVFVLTHWEPRVRDSGTFFGGFAVGAGEALTADLRLIVTVVGAPFSRELAEERDKFWESVKFMVSPEFLALMREFAASPVDYAKLAVEEVVRSFEERLWNLEFYEAGRQLGSLVASLAQLAPALKKLPKILGDLGRLIAAIPRISFKEVLNLGVPLEKLKEALARPLSRLAEVGRPRLAAVGGYTLAIAEDEVALFDKAARPLGKFSLSQALEDLASGAREAPAVVRGRLSLLPKAALAWLREDERLFRLASRVLRTGGPNTKLIMDAIRVLHRADNFKIVLRAALWGLSGTSRLHDNVARGALHVIRYVLKNFRYVDPRLIRFEVGAVSGIWRRALDVWVMGAKYEFKAVQGISPKIIRQLVRDLVREMRDLKVLHLVFERRSLSCGEAALRDALSRALREHPLFRGYPTAELERLVNGMVEFF